MPVGAEKLAQVRAYNARGIHGETALQAAFARDGIKISRTACADAVRQLARESRTEVATVATTTMAAFDASAAVLEHALGALATLRRIADDESVEPEVRVKAASEAASIAIVAQGEIRAGMMHGVDR